MSTESGAIHSATGCDKIGGGFEITRAGSQTFLLNKSTGEAKLVEGTTLIQLKPQEAAQSPGGPKPAKSWQEQSINDLPDVKFKLRTKYRDGAMLWNVEATPYRGALETVYSSTSSPSLRQPTVFLELYDAEGFKTGEQIEIKVRFGTRTVDGKGEVQSMSWSGSQVMSADTYNSASFVSTRWFGFSKD